MKHRENKAKSDARYWGVRGPDWIWRDENGNVAWDSQFPCVYFVHNARAKAMKIGTAHALGTRLSQLQCASPDELVLIGWISGGVETEQRLHGLCETLHMRGEWFHATPKLLRTVRLAIRIDTEDRRTIPNGTIPTDTEQLVTALRNSLA